MTPSRIRSLCWVRALSRFFNQVKGREYLAYREVARLSQHRLCLERNSPPVSARAIEPSSILSIPGVVVRRLFSTDGIFRQHIVDDLTRTQSIMLQELISLRTETTFERLKDWVLTAIREAEYAISIDLPYGKALLASRLGMAPETLSQNFARLETSGVLMEERKLRITNLKNFVNSLQSTPAIVIAAVSRLLDHGTSIAKITMLYLLSPSPGHILLHTL